MSDKALAKEVRLSVVLIGRNQAWNISRLIQSVRQAAPTAEILAVDSASSDASPELATAAGVRVARLAAGQHLSPSAGRAIGLANTVGDVTLFLDGDATLVQDWLASAVRLLSLEPDVAVVTGSRIVVPINCGDQDIEIPPRNEVTFDKVKRCGGSALYRTSVLAEVGGFDPWLHSEEEPELALRIRAGGYRLMRSNRPIIIDRTDDPDRPSTVLARRRRNLYLGTGQVLRKHWGSPIARMYARERWETLLAVGGWIAYVVAVVVVAAIGNFKLSAATAIAVPSIALLAMLARFRDLERTKLSVVRTACHIEGTIRGFFMRPRLVEDYSPRYKITDAPQGG